MRTELISIATPTHPLDGAYYTPEGPVDGAPMYCHIPARGWVISAHTYLDRLTNAPELVENAKRIECPVLFIRGDQEPMENYPAERFKENCAGACEVAIIPNCDHFYVGAEDRVAKVATEWLT